jgi:hypothetical protein
MLLEVYRCRRRAAMLGGTVLLALTAPNKSTSADASASRVNVAFSFFPGAAVGPSRVDTAFSVSPGAVGPGTIDACAANKWSWSTITAN